MYNPLQQKRIIEMISQMSELTSNKKIQSHWEPPPFLTVINGSERYIPRSFKILITYYYLQWNNFLVMFLLTLLVCLRAH